MNAEQPAKLTVWQAAHLLNRFFAYEYPKSLESQDKFLRIIKSSRDFHIYKEFNNICA